MFLLPFLASIPGAALLFGISLGVVIFASARFTRKLEILCETCGFSLGILSLLGALGANIPDYASAAVAIIAGHTDLGIGIILGSNIYNLAIILGLCTFFAPAGNGIRLNVQARRHVGVIAWYMFAILFCAWGVLALFPGALGVNMLPATPLTYLLFLLMAVLVCTTFGGLVMYILRRSHEHTEAIVAPHTVVYQRKPLTIVRLSGEILVILAIALGGVVVMVQAGQALTSDLHMPAVLAGLLVLAVATSLPNTIVALSLARTREVAACVEEISIGVSINTVVGIVLPVVIWQGVLQDHFLFLLDSPFLLGLASVTLFCIMRGRFRRYLGLVLLGFYIAWVVLRFWV